MGNSMRKTFGNLCGGEASKEQPDEDAKPLPKPRDQPNDLNAKTPEKKKKKKSRTKKKKKKHGGEEEEISDVKTEEQLPTVEEATEVEDGATTASVTPDQKPAEKNEAANEDYRDHREENSPASITLKEKASSSQFMISVGTAHEDKGQEGVVNMLFTEENGDTEGTDECEESDEEYGDDQNLSERRQEAKHSLTVSTSPNPDVSPDVFVNSPASQTSPAPQFSLGPTTRDSFSFPSVSSTSDDANIKQNIPAYLQVKEIKPEEIGINCVDEIFKESAVKYQIFVEVNQNFKTAILNFMENPCFNKEPTTKISDCLQIYKQMLEDSENQVDEVSELNVEAQFLQVDSQQLLSTVNAVRPCVQKSLKEAADVDVIEYVKEKVTDGVQLGITSKFSAPGKYRRNMKLLRSALDVMEGVETSVKKILGELLAIRSTKQSDSALSPEDDEEEIVPFVKPLDEDTAGIDELFSKLENKSDEDLRDVGDNRKHSNKPAEDGVKYERKLLTPENQNQQPTLLEQSSTIGSDGTVSVAGDKPKESLEVKPQVNHQLPIILPDNNRNIKTFDSRVVQVEQDDHNTLDFGNYILVDPNTSDIQVMRTRSRSLDSLASIKSNRSSISRFGSFEFVTDFEITIAEKNQQLMN